MRSVRIKNQDICYAPVFDGYFYSSFHSMDNPEEFWTNPAVLKQTIRKSAETFNPDIVMLEDVVPDNRKIFGCSVDLSSGFVPLFVSSAISSKSDIDSLTPFSKKNESARDIIPELTGFFKGRKLTTFAVKAPFETAFIMRGGSQFMMDLKKDPAFVSALLETLWRMIRPVIQDLADLGIDIITVKDSVASSSMVSPAIYEKFACPYETAMVTEIEKCNMKSILHICRNSSPIFSLMSGTGADILECDSPNDISPLFGGLKEHQCIKGNIDSVRDLEESFDDFLAAGLPELCRTAQQTGKLIISTGDSVTPGTPHDRLLKMESRIRSFFDECQ